ncbi:MAG: hypothetical protein J4469_01210 [Candidatus Aenigmarchaeota archaeon]|nr:hypothetical protein [Candidatus Aenigmarchaeota archaeon]
MSVDKWADCKEVRVNGEKRLLLNPQYREDYRLAYTKQGWYFKFGVYGVYFGQLDGKHFFLNEAAPSVLEAFTCPVQGCFLTFYSDGGDDPSISVVDATFDGDATDELESSRPIVKEYATKIIREVRKKACRIL